MRNKLIFGAAIIGLVVGLLSAYLFGIEKKPLPPAFNPASNPYPKGIYANGIIESYQLNGSNINIYPEVPGAVAHIRVKEGSTVKKGTPLILIDDSVQRATVEQQRAQVELAGANLKNSEDQLRKLMQSYELEPKSVSKNDLDNAENGVKVANANLGVAKKQFELAQTVLSKYTLLAPINGVVLSINTSVGSYISAQGTYDTYTQTFAPILVMRSSNPCYGVRCYIDEILVHRLPPPEQIRATMSIPGTDFKVPLEYVRIQPYVSPKIELSNQRTERVDVRVLPVIFKCMKPGNFPLYPGQLVDVFIEETGTAKTTGVQRPQNQ